jgi:peptidoglycan/xylan/chitin deacetylase (PgdA/CDA1 family)/outer membrane protein assembly factor BamB
MNRQKIRQSGRSGWAVIQAFFTLLSSAGLLFSQTLTLEQGGIVRGPKDKRQIALVFTADTYSDGVGYVLSALEERKVRGSFFLTGNFLRTRAFSALVERILDSGHYLGPHSDRYLLYCDWQDRKKTLVSREEFLSDLEKNYEELGKFGVNKESSRYFIPPYEWYNQEITDWALADGITIVNITPGLNSALDYTTPDLPNYCSSEEILRQIIEYEAAAPEGLNGFIILIHPGVAPERTDLLYFRLGELLDELLARGYSLVRIDEMLAGAEELSQGKSEKAVLRDKEKKANREREALTALTEKSSRTDADSQVIGNEIYISKTALKTGKPERLGARPEVWKSSLTRDGINWFYGCVQELVSVDGLVICFYENEKAEYGQVEVSSGFSSQLLGSKPGFHLTQKPVAGNLGLWLTSLNKIYRLAPDSGSAQLSIELTEPLAGPPVKAGGRLFLPFIKSVEARDFLTGQLLWKSELSEESSGLLVASESEVLVFCKTGRLLKINIRTGQKIKQYELEGRPTTVLLGKGGQLYFGLDSGRMGCFDLLKEKIRWQVDLGAQRIEHLLADGSYLYVLTSGSLLYKLNSGGDLIYWQTIPGRTFFRPVIFQGEIIFPYSNILYGFDCRTGKSSSQTVLTFEVKADLIVVGDRLFVGTSDHSQNLSLVYVLKKEPRVVIRASGSSPQSVGRRIVFSALAFGFENPKYEFYLLRVGEQEKTVSKASSKNTWTWVPVQPGEYLITVRVFDKKQSKRVELSYNIISLNDQNDLGKE